jgi:hypothetical protein
MVLFKQRRLVRTKRDVRLRSPALALVYAVIVAVAFGGHDRASAVGSRAVEIAILAGGVVGLRSSVAASSSQCVVRLGGEWQACPRAREPLPLFAL